MRQYTILLFLVPLLLAGCEKKDRESSPAATPAGANLRRTTVTMEDANSTYEAIGTVRSRTTSVLAAKVMGRVQAVLAREGDKVHAGQVLIEIDGREAEAMLQKAEAGIREAQAAQNQTAGAIQAGEATLAAAEAGSRLTELTLARFERLREQQAVSQQEFDEAQARHTVAAAQEEQARQSLAALVAQKGQVRARIEQAEAERENTRILLGHCKIMAPMDGIVIARTAEPGMMASPGVALITMEDDRQYRLEAEVEESRLQGIHLADQVLVRIDALTGVEVSGQVVEMVPTADPASRSAIVKIDLPGRGPGVDPYRSGLYGKAIFSIGRRQVLSIPNAALLRRGQLTSVWVVTADLRTQLRIITLGREFDGRVEILSGLSPGEEIVAEKVETVREGMAITVE